MKNEASAKNSRLRDVLELIITFAVALIAALLIRVFVFELVEVEGNSMRPTLYDNQTLFVEKVSRYFDGIDRGDIVIVRYPGREEAFVKRVVAVGGDRVEIKDGQLYINEVCQQEDYTLEDHILFDCAEETVPPDSYYVLGDNRNDSSDSRRVGPIPKEDVIGKACFVIWPISAIGGLG